MGAPQTWNHSGWLLTFTFFFPILQEKKGINKENLSRESNKVQFVSRPLGSHKFNVP